MTAVNYNTSPFKGPGYDGLSAVAWQKMWPVFRSHLVYLFEESLLQGRLPNTWKIAKIIPLRKSNKSDYTSPSAYRPISLLPTLSKAIESLVAERIAHLSDEYGLLLGNHFGGLKCKNTVDALLVLQEKIYQAWRDKKVLSLVTFDIQGAFNGVAKDVLCSRLRERRIPELLVNWISNFCSERKASIIVNGESSDQIALQDAGLTQGSPLSPILFLFFNADLVKSVINKNKGAIAFIDDYTLWVTGPEIQSNTEQLQREALPKVESLASSSGTIFNSGKTVLVHFTRNTRKITAELASPSALKIGGQPIYGQKEVKLLGVVFDQKLTYKEQIAKVLQRGTTAALGLKRLRNLRPERTRQLFKSTVVPVIDYASVIWSPGTAKSSLKKLDQIQRIGAQAVTGGFRTVALQVAEAEAGLQSVPLRHYLQQRATWISWHTKPDEHRFWKVKKSICLDNTRWISPLQRIAEKLKAITPVLANIEKIRPYTRSPETQHASVIISKTKEQAVKEAKMYKGAAVYVDSSARKVGIGAHWQNMQGWGPMSHTIADNSKLTNDAGELAAIEAVIAKIWFYAEHKQLQNLQISIFTDSVCALNMLSHSSRSSGQFLAGSILRLNHLICISQQNIRLNFQWSPAHCKFFGNDSAHGLA